jgi:hypothetical protein
VKAGVAVDAIVAHILAAHRVMTAAQAP